MTDESVSDVEDELSEEEMSIRSHKKFSSFSMCATWRVVARVLSGHG